jgi:hypothetical protein
VTPPQFAQAESLYDRIEVLGIETSPFPVQHGWVRLPKGPGVLYIHVKTKNVISTNFWLVPTGTETWALREFLGKGTKTTDGWSFEFHYGDEEFLDHLVIELISIRETANTSINLMTEKSRSHKLPTCPIF